MTFKSQAEFSNISFTDRSRKEDSADQTGSLIQISSFETNLTNLIAYGDAVWEDREEGLYSDASGQGTSLLCSDTSGTDFVYSSNVHFLREMGTATLIFRSDSSRQNAYGLSINGMTKTCRLTRWQDGIAYQLIEDREIDAMNNAYDLKVVAIDDWITCYVNDVLVASTGDYILQSNDRGQNTILTDGFFGLQNMNGEIVFQNAMVTQITDENTPVLSGISVSSQNGSVEESSVFSPFEPVRIQFVGNETETVDIGAVPKSSSAIVTVMSEDGTEYPGGTQVPINEGINRLTVSSTTQLISGSAATVNYRLLVWRRQSRDFNEEPYRDQYHYSVREGRANDPNGLVYYNDMWHFFYQFSTGLTGGPKHWAHAVSQDLITWQERPIAFYPDSNGSMYSGCVVVDENNTSGLFSNDRGGLVALISVNGNGQRIKAAYSEDGEIWTKLDNIVLDWTEDPLYVTDLRDPKVFRWENKWFMVVAGGPLRIYSSDNLLDWTYESSYPNINTECPDLYPLRASDGKVKWVLSEGGRSYKVGKFSCADGKWTFIPDEPYAGEDGIMNFGSDSYAAMTYYIQDFGTEAAPSFPEMIEVNWMNTLEDYRNLVGEQVNGFFNGTFTLHLDVGLVFKNGIYQMTQTPIDAYKSLRDEQNATILNGVEVTENNSLLSDLSGDCYEIVSTFSPGEDTRKVGFRLRVGDGEETLVVYDLESEELSIDRSKSGIILSEQFAQASRETVTRNDDGTINLHIYVDRVSVEVFANGGIAAGAVQVFPSETSSGIDVVIEGGPAKADLEIYPMHDMRWNS